MRTIVKTERTSAARLGPVLVVSRFRVARRTPRPSAPTSSGRVRRWPPVPGYVEATIGRNVDDPTLWVLVTRWENVGAYRRALSSYDVKLRAVPLLSRAIDEPSAYEIVEPGADLNIAPDPVVRLTPSTTGSQPAVNRRSSSVAKPPPSTVDHVVSLAKRRGFVYPCGEIYGGTRSAWDYGPLGVELKENIKRQWWKSMVQMRDDMVGLDSSVILPRQTWEASGHVDTFTDPLTECQSCHKRFRADHLQEEAAEKQAKKGGERPRQRRPRHARLPQLRHPRRLDRAPRSSPACSRPTSASPRTSPACTTCAPRPRRASSSTSPTS